MTSAVKAAVIVSTQSLEAEWAKYGIAWAVIFLASDQANFIIMGNAVREWRPQNEQP